MLKLEDFWNFSLADCFFLSDFLSFLLFWYFMHVVFFCISAQLKFSVRWSIFSFRYLKYDSKVSSFKLIEFTHCHFHTHYLP